MMSKKRIIGMITIAALMAGLVAMPVMAASKKKIKSVNVKVDSNVLPQRPASDLKMLMSM